MKSFLTVILLGCLIVGCAEPTPPPAARDMSLTQSHSLMWEVYDGTGDPATAVYLLDGERLGAGSAGLSALRQRISAMPRGAQIKIIPYYGDPGGVRRSYPFDKRELREFAASYGVELMIPMAR